MHKLLVDIFTKRKIENIKDLSQEEQDTYDKWNRILSDGDVTVLKINTFCKHQVALIEKKWASINNDQSQKGNLIPIHTVYKTISKMIESPRSERESLEKYLNQLLD